MGKAVRYLGKRWYICFFAFAAVFTVWMDALIARSILDGDASSALCKAYVIAQENNLFTTAFYGTTEARLFDITLVIAPFFKLFSNWTLVRICGTVVLQTLYVLSFQYLITPFVTSKAAKWTASALLLMPFSTAYARDVLYHLHYIVYIIYAFLLLGMLLRFVSGRREGRARWVTRLCFMAVLSFVVGLNGVRHMMILLAPLLLLTTVHIFLLLRHYQLNELSLRGNNAITDCLTIRLFGYLLFSCVFFLIGFVLNQTVILSIYNLPDMSSVVFMPVPNNWKNFPYIFSGVLVDIGFRTASANALSARSVAMAAALFGFGYLFWASFRYGYTDEKKEKDVAKTILYGFLSVSFCVSTFIFMSDISIRYYALYYLPVIVMAFPVLALECEWLKEKVISAARKIVVGLVCLTFLFQGAYTASYVLHKNTSEMDIWSGLYFENVMAVECVQDCIAFMHIYGYTHAMLPFWYANVMTECSDGTLMVGSYGNEYNGVLSLYKWETFKTAFLPENLPDQLVIFIEADDKEQFVHDYPDSEEVFEGAYFTGYTVDTERVFSDYQPSAEAS